MLSDIKHILRAVLTFQFRELKNIRLFKIGIVGTIGFIIQASFFEIFGLQLKVFSPALAALLGAEVSIFITFSLNNIFTFPEQRILLSRRFFKKFLQFNFMVALSLFIQWIMVRVGELVARDAAMILRGFNVLGVLVGLIFNYSVYTKFIWKEEKVREAELQSE